jgi:hypothetical protein
MSVPLLAVLLIGLGAAAAAQNAPEAATEPVALEGQFRAVRISPDMYSVTGLAVAEPGKKPTAVVFVPLAQPPADQPRAERPLLQPQPQRLVVRCGIKVLPADPAVDPRIAMPVPNGSVDYTIRTVQPPPCDD